jgi:GH3 auxin-responsive promoter
LRPVRRDAPAQALCPDTPAPARAARPRRDAAPRAGGAHLAAGATRFGREHGFDSIRTVEEFQARVPIRRYEDFWGSYWQPRFPDLAGVTWPGRIPYLAVSSGTSTGRTKYIPVSREVVRANRRAGIDLLVRHVASRPESRVLGGKNFMLGGTVELREEGAGVLSGDLTGIARREVPAWGRPYVFPSAELAREADWERRIERIGRASLDAPIRTVAGTPSWLLLFFERLAAMTGHWQLAEICPGLELVSHGGLAFTPYRQVFAEWLEDSGAELREVYPASEGFVALADRGPGEGLRMLIDSGLFYEFVPVEDLERPEPVRHWIGHGRSREGICARAVQQRRALVLPARRHGSARRPGPAAAAGDRADLLIPFGVRGTPDRRGNRDGGGRRSRGGRARGERVLGRPALPRPR